MEIPPAINVNVRSFTCDRVHPNPWQTRMTDDVARIQTLAEDIRKRGLLQIPIARLHPQDMEAVQLAFGHRRFAAWQIAKPGEPFPIDLRQLSDREMADFAAVENAQREDITPIEKAQAIQKRINDFDLSQLEAGEHFGYTSQGAVANLLRLLKLPKSLQKLIGEAGGLPERHARNLINLARSLPNQAQQIAEEVAKAENKDEVFNNALGKTLRAKARHLWDAPFEKTATFPIDHVAKTAEKMGLRILPACKGCEFFINHKNDEYCMRPGCFDLKCQAKAWQETEHLAKKLGIKILKDGEKTQLLFNGKNNRTTNKIATAITTKDESLRLVPNASNDYNRYMRERVLGSKHVELHTTNMREIKKAIAKLPKEKKKSAAAKIESPVKRKLKRMQKRCNECQRLMRAAAPYIAKAFKFPEAVLDAMIPAMANHHFQETSGQLISRATKADAAGKAQIIAEIVMNRISQAGFMYSNVTPAAATKKIQALAVTLKVKLPANWAMPHE
jgi:ParB/RepB/Spo0J family partition protein